jgi:hypothetical protein
MSGHDFSLSDHCRYCGAEQFESDYLPCLGDYLPCLDKTIWVDPCEDYSFVLEKRGDDGLISLIDKATGKIIHKHKFSWDNFVHAITCGKTHD